MNRHQTRYIVETPNGDAILNRYGQVIDFMRMRDFSGHATQIRMDQHGKVLDEVIIDGSMIRDDYNQMGE